MTETPYTPIDCADYDLYEIAIMQGRQLSLSTLSGQLRVKPVALKIEAGAEFLYFHQVEPASTEPEHAEQKIRLDEISHIELLDK